MRAVRHGDADVSIQLDFSAELRLALRDALAEVVPKLIAVVRSAADDRLVGVDEGARLLGVSTAALRKRVARGQVKVVRLGRSVRLRVSDLLGVV
jgi:excisionase family DNA binding protein